MVLAGPVLRRVESKSVNAWIALDEDAEIVLTLKDSNDLVAGSSSAQKHKIGTKLFIYLVSFVPVTDMLPGKIFSYDLTNAGISILTPLLKADVPLGYKTDALPSFLLPAADKKDLIVAHGSCRRMHGDGPEALSNLDNLLQENLSKPETRIQQLFLTGDQIYADEIPHYALWSITEKAKELISAVEDIPLPAITVDGVVRPAKRILPSDAIPGLRSPLLTEYASMTTSAGESHLITFGEYCIAHLHAWSQDIWKPELVDAVKNFSKLQENYDIYKVKVGLNKENYQAREYLHHPDKARFEEIIAKFPDFEKSQRNHLAAELKEVANFYESLPRVRRILANIPTYMIFDDHEITDDWNISMKWKNEVYANQLGKTILRNGLMAYAICQDLGNVPADYADAQSKKNTLAEEIKKYAVATAFDDTLTTRIDELLGLSTIDAQPTVQWHYHLNSGNKVKTLFLDTRNRRGFKSLHSRPELLDEKAFNDQFTFPSTPAEDEMLFVISACPVIGLAVFEEMIYPMATSLKGFTKKGERSFGAGEIIFDNEAWYLSSKAFEQLLSRLSAFKKAVIFSGDVHYGFTTVLDYWKKAETAPASRFIQLVSSPLKNLWKKNTRLFQSGFVQGVFSGFGGMVEKFGWEAAPTVEGVDISLVNRRKLRETPAVMDNFGLQKTVKIKPDSDWRYRLTLPFDERKDDAIDNLAATYHLLDDNFDRKKIADLRRLAERFTEDFRVARSRRLMYANHVCVVSFKEEKLVHTYLYRSAADPDIILRMVLEVPLAPVSDAEKKRPEFETVSA